MKVTLRAPTAGFHSAERPHARCRVPPSCARDCRHRMSPPWPPSTPHLRDDAPPAPSAAAQRRREPQRPGGPSRRKRMSGASGSVPCVTPPLLGIGMNRAPSTAVGTEKRDAKRARACTTPGAASARKEPAADPVAGRPSKAWRGDPEPHCPLTRPLPAGTRGWSGSYFRRSASKPSSRASRCGVWPSSRRGGEKQPKRVVFALKPRQAREGKFNVRQGAVALPPSPHRAGHGTESLRRHLAAVSRREKDRDPFDILRGTIWVRATVAHVALEYNP